MKKHLQHWVSFLLPPLSLSLCLVCVEIVLRLFFAIHYNEGKYQEYDAVLGWQNRKNVRMDIAVRDGSVYRVEHNSKGLRESREYDHLRSEKARVLFLGDSFVWGFGVNAQKRFTDLLDVSLGEDVEVINMGVAGYSTDQELLALQREGVDYRPDLIVLGFLGTNDVEGNISEVMYGAAKPRFLISQEDSSPILANVPVPNLRRAPEGAPWVEKTKRYLAQHSLAYKFFRRQYHQLFRAEEMRTATLEQLQRQFAAYDVRLPQRYLEGWTLTERLLVRIQAVADSVEAKFLIAALPRENQLAPSKWDSSLLTIDLDPQHFQADFPDRMLAEIGARNGIRVISVLPALQRRYRRGDKLYITGDGHWNERGHEVVAEFLYDAIAEMVAAERYSHSGDTPRTHFHHE